MHSAAMSAGASPTIVQSQGQNPSVRFLRLAHLRKLRRCEQVAAICFRTRGGAIEFLLVQTGKGRWIFPKGNAEPGLTHAQAAALEAFEEAGVHGRMEEASFTRYIQRKRGKMRRLTELVVSAHLCEVLRLVTPSELNRDPTWFPAEKAKRRLRDDRPPDHGADLARVVDRAVARIQRLRSGFAAAPESVSSAHPSQARARANSKNTGQKARLIAIDSARRSPGKSKAASAG
jgi:8-oxo-dGTP pyrophosphatase MutT (NUDIX family)